MTLFTAVGKGDLDAVKILIQKGADLHAEGDNALRLAAFNGHPDIVKILKNPELVIQPEFEF